MTSAVINEASAKMPSTTDIPHTTLPKLEKSPFIIE
jgi:hypothetical protein